MLDAFLTIVLAIYWLVTIAIALLWVMGKIVIIYEEIMDMRKDKMKAKQAIVLAKKHIKDAAPMADSAKLCLSDAETLLKSGFEKMAKKRALKSLSYSVGICHEDYKKAAKE